MNDYLASLIMSKSKDIQRIDGLLRKISTQEAEDYALEDNSTFRKVYFANGNEDRFNFAMGDLRMYLDKMNRFKNGIFTRHLIDDTISRGQSVNEAVSRLKQCYAPKSITVLTLLSKLD